MKNNRITSSLEHIRMPEHHRQPLLDSLLAQAKQARREESMKKKFVRRFAAGVAAALVVAAAALIIFLHPTPATPVPEGALPTASEAPAGGDISGNIILLSNLTLADGLAESFTAPDSLMIARQTPVAFTNEDISVILESLESHGWQDVSRVSHDFPGMLNFTQPQTYDYDGYAKDKGEDISGSAQHKAWGAKFLADSSIADVLRRYGTEISVSPGDEEFATLFWGYVNEYRTETYLRLHFTPDGTLGDAQLYAVQLKPFIDADVLPLTEAIKYAFYCSECTSFGDDPFTVTETEIVYRNGIPFYSLTLHNDEMVGLFVGYSLAVSEDALHADPDAYAAYKTLLENGIW